MTSPSPGVDRTTQRAAPGRFESIDGLRAIAAILIVIHHASYPSARMYVGHFANQFTQLDVGVAVFFLISGFVMYRPFSRRLLAGESEPSLGGYLWRRAARIFPAYWCALTVIIVVGRLTDGALLGLPSYPKSWSGYVPYYGLVHVYRNLDEARGGINQAWTLAVEITFYAFVPLFAALMRRISMRRSLQARYTTQWLGLLALVAVSVAFRALVFWGPSDRLNAVGEYWLPSHLDYFACGMALALLSLGGEFHLAGTRARSFARQLGVGSWFAAAVLFFVGANALEVGIDHRPEGWAGFYKHAFHGAVALLLILPAVFESPRSIVRRLLTQPAALYLGTISYGIYLWHQSWIGQATRWQLRPVFDADMTLLLVFGLTASIATAALSWQVLERPIVRTASRRSASKDTISDLTSKVVP